MKIPQSVKIISLISFIEGILLFILGGLLLLGGVALTAIISFLGPVIAGFGIFFVLLGLFNMFVYRSLRSGKNWSRIYIIIVSSLAVLSTIINGLNITSIIMVIHLLILYYMIFDKKTINHFK